MKITKVSTVNDATYIRSTPEVAAQLSKLALSLFTVNQEAFKVTGLTKPSIKVAIAYCVNLAQPEFKSLGVEITAKNNIWLQIQAEGRKIYTSKKGKKVLDEMKAARKLPKA